MFQSIVRRKFIENNLEKKWIIKSIYFAPTKMNGKDGNFIAGDE